MIDAFFGKTAYIGTIPEKDRRTANALQWTTICLPEVTMDYLKYDRNRIDDSLPIFVGFSALLEHFLFLFIKSKMPGQHFNSTEEAVKAYNCHVSAAPTFRVA